VLVLFVSAVLSLLAVEFWNSKPISPVSLIKSLAAKGLPFLDINLGKRSVLPSLSSFFICSGVIGCWSITLLDLKLHFLTLDSEASQMYAFLSS